MKRTTERRLTILQILCERRKETLENLAFELKVCRNTIQRDIDTLSLSFPIYTLQGSCGGVYIVDGFRLGMKYLTDEQYEVLERLSKETEKKDAEILQSIMKTFKQPTRKII